MSHFSDLCTNHHHGGMEQYWFAYCGRSETPGACSYGYKDKDGSIFQCVARTLEDCRAKRDEWIKGWDA